jgi:hypothetical protein
MPEPVTVSTARFTYQGITFSYANGLIRRLTTVRLPASQGVTGLSANEADAYYLGVPDFLVFNFDKDSQQLSSSRLVVEPLRDGDGVFFAGYPEREIGRFEQLAARLETAEETMSEPLSRLLHFENGSGVRTVSYLPKTAEPVPVADEQVFFLFEGLTDDGRYYVWLQFNLQTPILPDESGQFSEVEREKFVAETADYQTYLQEQLGLVTALPETAFTPDLALLDALVISLQVPPEASVSSSLPVNEEGCENSAVATDGTIPDGTKVEMGQSFIKTWRIENRGTCTWSASYQFVSEESTLLRNDELVMPLVLPGETAEISLAYRAPLEIGVYQETWQIRSPSPADQESSNEVLDTKLTVIVEVVNEVP